ncbi:unnamed protein product [Protopolystoma xenopodis]|uniref:Uncharacterized protein n=1 Tax=Protopolystoma xenopodis TaxID=117903 RepID=A0A448XGW6_9PLAT|nr:unnamed protein product [Protopolystoma xenopodis]
MKTDINVFFSTYSELAWRLIYKAQIPDLAGIGPPIAEQRNRSAYQRTALLWSNWTETTSCPLSTSEIIFTLSEPSTNRVNSIESLRVPLMRRRQRSCMRQPVNRFSDVEDLACEEDGASEVKSEWMAHGPRGASGQSARVAVTNQALGQALDPIRRPYSALELGLESATIQDLSLGGVTALAHLKKH